MLGSMTGTCKPFNASAELAGAIAQPECWLPRRLYASGSTINSASSHSSGVENDCSPRFGKLPIEIEPPVLGSIQNAFSMAPVFILLMWMEKTALLPRYAMIHCPSRCRAARFSTCPLVFPPLAKIAWSGTRFYHSFRARKTCLRIPICTAPVASSA